MFASGVVVLINHFGSKNPSFPTVASIFVPAEEEIVKFFGETYWELIFKSNLLEIICGFLFKVT